MARPDPNTCSQKCGKVWEGAPASISILCAALLSCAQNAGQPGATSTASNTTRATVERPYAEGMIFLSMGVTNYIRLIDLRNRSNEILRSLLLSSASCCSPHLLVRDYRAQKDYATIKVEDNPFVAARQVCNRYRKPETSRRAPRAFQDCCLVGH